jgi:hypothetical protein
MLSALQSNYCRSLLATLATFIPLFARKSKFIYCASKDFCPEKISPSTAQLHISGKSSLNEITAQLSLLSEHPIPSLQGIHELIQFALYAHSSGEPSTHSNHLGSTADYKIEICFNQLIGQTITTGLHTAIRHRMGVFCLNHLCIT